MPSIHQLAPPTAVNWNAIGVWSFGNSGSRLASTVYDGVDQAVLLVTTPTGTGTSRPSDVFTIASTLSVETLSRPLTRLRSAFTKNRIDGSLMPTHTLPVVADLPLGM